MSHFSVMVAIKDDSNEELERVLQPYHEYECTGINDQYVKFVEIEEDAAELKSDFEENYSDEYSTFNEYLSEYHGYEMVDGKIGTYTNPDRKWDWWVIGGRWSNTLVLKNSGESCDYGLKNNIDFEKMKQDSVSRSLPAYDKAIEIIGESSFFSWAECRKIHSDLDGARKLYNRQDAIVRLRKEYDNPFHDVDQYLASREDFIKQREFAGISSFSILHDGKWTEKGEMGWFACVSDEKEAMEWEDIFTKTLAGIPDDYTIVVVDCHI